MRSASEDLKDLARVTATLETLKNCQGLAKMIFPEVEVGHDVAEDGRGALLYEVLSRVANDATRKALQNLKNDPRLKLLEDTSCQVAAASELLGMASSEDEFWQMRELIDCDDLSWDDIQKIKDHQPTKRKRQIRAGIWLGKRSYKSAERYEDRLLRAFEENVKEYAVENRDEIGVLAYKYSTTGKSAHVPPTLSLAPANHSLHETPRIVENLDLIRPDRTISRWLRSAYDQILKAAIVKRLLPALIILIFFGAVDHLPKYSSSLTIVVSLWFWRIDATVYTKVVMLSVALLGLFSSVMPWARARWSLGMLVVLMLAYIFARDVGNFYNEIKLG